VVTDELKENFGCPCATSSSGSSVPPRPLWMAGVEEEGGGPSRFICLPPAPDPISSLVSSGRGCAAVVKRPRIFWALNGP
jgi:hypothetical protein